MEHCAATQPETFFAVCARLIGPEVKMTIESQPVGLEPQDIAVLKAIRQAIPDADRQSPEQILAHVLMMPFVRTSPEGYSGPAEAEGLKVKPLKRGHDP